MSRNATRQSVIVRAEGRSRTKSRCQIPPSPPPFGQTHCPTAPPKTDHRSDYANRSPMQVVDKYKTSNVSENERLDSGYNSMVENVGHRHLWTPVDKVMTQLKVASPPVRHYNNSSSPKSSRRDGEKATKMVNGQSSKSQQEVSGKEKCRSGNGGDYRYKPYEESDTNSFDNSGRIEEQQRGGGGFLFGPHRMEEAHWSRTTVHPEHLALINSDMDGDLPIHLAVAREDEVGVNYIIQCMLSHRLSLDFCNKRLQTSLHIGVLTGHLGIIKALLSSGACPRLPDRQGNTAVHLAVQNSSIPVLELLLDSSSGLKTLSRRNNSGFTPLHLAIFRKNLGVIAYLLSKGSDCNLVDGTSGRSALFHAVSGEQEDAVSTLIRFGASVNLPNYAGVTPLVVATDKRLKNISRLLISKGATMSAKDEL